MTALVRPELAYLVLMIIFRFQAPYSMGLHSSLKIGINILQPRVSESRAFGAGLTTLDGPITIFLDHVCLQAPKYPAGMGRLAVEPQDRNQTLSNPELCESGAFGAGLTELAAHKLVFLDHVSLTSPNCISRSGAASNQASRCALKSVQPRIL